MRDGSGRESRGSAARRGSVRSTTRRTSPGGGGWAGVCPPPYGGEGPSPTSATPTARALCNTGEQPIASGRTAEGLAVNCGTARQRSLPCQVGGRTHVLTPPWTEPRWPAPRQCTPPPDTPRWWPRASPTPAPAPDSLPALALRPTRRRRCTATSRVCPPRPAGDDATAATAGPVGTRRRRAHRRSRPHPTLLSGPIYLRSVRARPQTPPAGTPRSLTTAATAGARIAASPRRRDAESHRALDGVPRGPHLDG
jgi:hypothetical protein